MKEQLTLQVNKCNVLTRKIYFFKLKLLLQR